MVSFWFSVVIICLLSYLAGSWFDSSADKGKYNGTFFSTIATILALSYILVIKNHVEIPHHSQYDISRSLADIPCEEEIEHFIFVESANATIPTEIVCPYVRPIYTQTTNLDLLYNISVKSASVNYSNYYVNECTSLYRWMGNRIHKGEINSLPIRSIHDFEDGATFEVALYASWERFCVFDIHRNLVLKSTVFIIPRAENMTYADWKLECQAKLDALEDYDHGWITYLNESEVLPEYSMYIKPENINQSDDSEAINYTYKAMPKMKRTLNLRQDLYHTCNDSLLIVKNVRVSSLAEGGDLG